MVVIRKFKNTKRNKHKISSLSSYENKWKWAHRLGFNEGLAQAFKTANTIFLIHKFDKRAKTYRRHDQIHFKEEGEIYESEDFQIES